MRQAGWPCLEVRRGREGHDDKDYARQACRLRRCEPTRARDDLARCTADGADIAEQLVRGGHVFASNELFASYASSEREAAGAGAGLWSGVAERPSEYRAKKWDEAKRTAPDGCPIKGRVSEIGRVYVLPWSPSYDRVKVRTAKGERWFCSEDEARAAGWKPTTRL